MSSPTDGHQQLLAKTPAWGLACMTARAYTAAAAAAAVALLLVCTAYL
jgi:hypothetical protein